MRTSISNPKASVDLDQLRAELIAAGLDPPDVIEHFEGGVRMDWSVDVPADLVDKVVAAHQPSLRGDFDNLTTKAQRVWDGKDAFTPAETQRILAGLVLLVSRRL